MIARSHGHWHAQQVGVSAGWLLEEVRIVDGGTSIRAVTEPLSPVDVDYRTVIDQMPHDESAAGWRCRNRDLLAQVVGGLGCSNCPSRPDCVRSDCCQDCVGVWFQAK